jgi:antitoxin Phd
MDTWQIQEAKNKLSELIDRAQNEGAQVITRHGVEVAVVMPINEYKKLAAPKQRMGEFLMNSPLRASGLIIERDKRTELRDIDL